LFDSEGKTIFSTSKGIATSAAAHQSLTNFMFSVDTRDTIGCLSQSCRSK